MQAQGLDVTFYSIVCLPNTFMMPRATIIYRAQRLELICFPHYLNETPAVPMTAVFIHGLGLRLFRAKDEEDELV